MSGRRPILVAEDNPLNFELIQEVLEADGFQVHWARSGEEALERVRAGYDLLLLDLHMPGLDGFQVLEALRAESAYDRMAILVLTADVMPTVADRARSIGADGFIAKPINVPAFLPQVEAWAAGRQPV